MTKPKRKPRGVVARFLAGESIFDIITHDNPSWISTRFEQMHRVEATLRRALKKKVGKR